MTSHNVFVDEAQKLDILIILYNLGVIKDMTQKIHRDGPHVLFVEVIYD